MTSGRSDMFGYVELKEELEEPVSCPSRIRRSDAAKDNEFQSLWSPSEESGFQYQSITFNPDSGHADAESIPPLRDRGDWKSFPPGLTSVSWNSLPRYPFPDDPEDNAESRRQQQHRAITNLQNRSSLTAGLGNYSRTPELRVSHKLEERKRRSEMKELFDDLDKAVPNNGVARGSKWEILSKGILSP
jgi:hypothetical protein